MANKNHSLVVEGSRHAVHNLTYPDAANRIAGTNEGKGITVTIDNLWQWAKQDDNDTLWMLSSVAPLTWIQVFTVGTIDTNATYDGFGTSPANVVIDGAEGQGDLVFKPTGARALQIDMSGTASGSTYGFSFINGSDSINIYNNTTGNMAALVQFQKFHIEADDSSEILLNGATADLNLGARATAIALNESGDEDFDSGFTADSIVGCVNEARLLTNDYTASDSESSTTSNAAQTNLKTARVMPAGNYILYWTCAAYIQSPATYCEIEIWDESAASSISISSIPNSDYLVTSGFIKVTFAVTKGISMYYRRVGGTAGQSAFIKNARLMFLEVK
jgi:hypothetical protein